MEIFQTRRSSARGFTIPDFIFVLVVICTLMIVGFLGVDAYHEAKKTEDAKKYGEDLTAWLTKASKERFKSEYTHGPCAGGKPPAPVSTEVTPADIPPPVESTETATNKADAEAPEPVAGTWGACLNYLFKHTEFKDVINKFSDEPPQFVPVCNPADHALAGAVFIEKMVPTPAGSAVPLVNSPLAETDPIDQKMQLRLSVCDKGAYPLKISEFEF